MLTFFRKNQRIFFLFITIVIIVTFVFFGTYNTFAPTKGHDETTFETVSGKGIKASYLEQMTRFLRSDAKEASLHSNPYRSYQGNFLNDGVVVKDFLQTGMAQVLFQAFQQDLSQDLQARLDKEKYYTPYRHPYAGFISAENVWGMFAPQLKNSFEELKACNDVNNEEAFKTRVSLYLQERDFPPGFLKQILLYQEKQYDWIPADQNLIKESLTLYGYRDLNDWFGPKFVQLVAQVIINSASIAKERGYKVNKDEAYADLMYQSQLAYDAIKDKSQIPVKNGYSYFQEYLRLTQMDEQAVVSIWQDVLLFRRLFNDIGSSVLVDALVMKDFQQYAHQAVEISVYQLPLATQIKDVAQMQQFEFYLDAISVGAHNNSSLMPTQLKSIEEVEAKYPDLIEKRFWVETASVNKKHLQSKVSIKEAWEWQIDAKNWDKLSKEYPELAQKTAQTSEERFNALEQIDERTRHLIDQFARSSIVDEHPEWINEALESASFQEEILAICNDQCALEGILKAQELAKTLENLAVEEVITYQQDQEHFYKIRLKEKMVGKNILTYQEASEKGILEKLLKSKLEKNPNLYEDVFVSLKQFCNESGIKVDFDNKNELVSYRFYPYLASVHQKALNKNESFNEFLAANENQTLSLLEKAPLHQQWRLEKNKKVIDRSHAESFSLDEIVALQAGAFSELRFDEKLGPNFYQFHQFADQRDEIAQQLKQYQELLASEAKCNALRGFLERIQDKKAISLK